MTLTEGQRIVVTGASGQVGRALLQSLLWTRAETIAITRRRPVGLPARRVIAAPLTSREALAAIQAADYVVHLAGAVRPEPGVSYRAANVEPARAVATALRRSRVRRVIFLSYVGADEASPNRYLRAKALAERLLASTGRRVVVFRSSHIIGSPQEPGPTASTMLAEPGKRVIVLGSGRQVVAPVYLGDVVSAIRAAMTPGPSRLYELAGPEQMSIDELVQLLNGDPRVPILHLPRWIARGLALALPTLPWPMVDVMSRDSIGDPLDAVVELGLKLTPLRAIWVPHDRESDQWPPPT